MFLRLQPLLNRNPLPDGHRLCLSLDTREVRIEVPPIAYKKAMVGWENLSPSCEICPSLKESPRTQLFAALKVYDKRFLMDTWTWGSEFKPIGNRFALLISLLQMH